MLLPQYAMTPKYNLHSIRAARRNFHWNFSSIWTCPEDVPASCCSRRWRCSFSSWSRNPAIAGLSGNVQGRVSPTRTVAMPSRRKIQRHPSRPPFPLSFSIAKASKPEKAPARDAAEKKTAIRVWISKRQYQLLDCKALISFLQARSYLFRERFRTGYIVKR